MNTTTRIETIERTERPWGWYETVSEVAGNKVKRIRVHPGQQLSLQKHHQRAEHWVGVVGAGHDAAASADAESGRGFDHFASPKSTR